MTTHYKSIVEEAEKELANLMDDIFIRELRESLLKIEDLDERILKRVNILSVLEESVDEVRKSTRRSIAKLKTEVEEKIDSSFASYQVEHTDTIKETKKTLMEKLAYNDNLTKERINELTKEQQQINEAQNLLLENHHQKVLQQLDSILMQQENGIDQMKEQSTHIATTIGIEQKKQLHQLDEELEKVTATILTHYDSKTMKLESTLKEQIVELQDSLTALKAEQEETIKMVAKQNLAHEKEGSIQKQNLKRIGWVVGCGIGVQVCLEILGFFLK